MIFLDKKEGAPFKILNLTDVQATAQELNGENAKHTAIIRGTIRELVERTRPSLITLSGDQSWCGAVEANHLIASLLDEYGIPYACAWGNHDQDGGLDKLDSVIEEYARHPLFTYENGPCELGRGNYVIAIREGDRVVSALIVMDTHDRVPYGESGSERMVWARPTEAQYEWYAEQITALKALGCEDATILTHIPIHAYRLAWNEAYCGADDYRTVTTEQSASGECWREGYKSSFGVRGEDICAYPEDEHFFDVIRANGIVKNYLCGHDHVSSFSIEYQGVRLSYCLKTGPGCYWKPELNGGTLITIGESGVCDVHHEYVDPSKFIQGEDK